MVAHHVPVLQLTERLRDAENDSMAKIAELEKQLSQARKELETLRVRLGFGLGWAPKNRLAGVSGLDIPSLPWGKRWGLSATEPGACRWALTPSLGLAGALRRVNPHGHLQTSPGA